MQKQDLIKSSILVILFLTFIPCYLLAYQFHNITENQGLSSRRAYSIAKDNKGFVWIANMVGIDKYDGENFYHYNFYQYNDYSKIAGVVADRKGNIYAFSENSLYRYNEHTDCLIKVNIDNFNKSRITTIYFDKNNHFWVGTFTGLFYSTDGSHWTKIKAMNNYQAMCFVETQNSELVIGTDKGVYSMDISKPKNLNKLNAKPYIANFSKLVRSLYFNSKNKTLWVGTMSDGVFLFNSLQNQCKQLLTTNAPVRTLCKAPNNDIWVGTDGKGIFTFDSSTGALNGHYSKESLSDSKIESNSILYIICYESTVYISTITDGIWYCNFAEREHVVYKNHSGNPNSLCNNYVNSMLEDNLGNIWFGTQSGLSKYTPNSRSWKHFLNGNNNESNVILALCEDSYNNIWAGGYGTDLICINNISGRISAIANKLDNSKIYIYSIIQDENGNIWFGGATKLTKYDPKNKTFEHFPVSGIHKIIEYNNNTILVASIFGLYFIDKTSKEIKLVDFSKMKINERSLIPNINDVYIDPINPDNLWLGSNGGGLYKYDVKLKSIQVFTVNGEPTSNFIGGIVRDDFNRLWISSENELNSFNLTSNKFEQTYAFNELPNNFFNFLSNAKCKNGNIIWGTPYGGIVINPKEIKNSTTPINLRFTAFNLFYQRVSVNSKNSPLNKVIDKTEHLTLNNSQRSFSFEFINVLGSLHSKTLYNWKLEGFDKEWSASTKEHKAVYTNVPPGDYKFIIKATNVENQRESVTRYIDVTIKPPFWASSLAYLIYFILITALGYFVIRYWKNRIEVKHSEERIRFFVNMAHDVRTPITLVKAPLNEIEHENLTDNGRSALSLAQRNLDKLFNLITQLLDFQRVESDAMQLNVEETALNEFMTNAIGNFSQLAKEKNIELDIILPPDEFNVWIDRKKLTLCLENLLSNAIKYTATAGKIQARVSTNESLLFIEIADDGIGIPLKNQKNLFERFFRAENAINSNETGSGIGLMLTKKLVLMQKGKISFKSIERLGTTFTLEIPCSKDAFKPTELIQKNDFSNNIIEEEDIEESISLKKIKILLVEDNNEIRDYLSKQLRREYRVEEAPDGNKALELAKKTAPDFILSDIMMPGIDGFELCSILKRNIETCHIPILLLSSLSDRADIVKGLSVGADDYITKPFDMAILEMKIKSIVNNRILFKKKFIDKSAIEDEFGTINPLDKQFLERVIIYVEENLINDDFSIDTIAIEMAMSRSVFYKKLKALTADNPKDFIKEIKMKKAAVLLKEKKYQISEIAYLTGFRNSDYFSTAFKSYYNTSPSKFLEEENV